LQVFTFGSGDCGQLAHGVEEDEDMMVKFPRIVRSLQNKNILRVACGGLHSAAITQDGEVFTWGCNDDGALGRGGEENLPAKVNGFESGSCIVDVSKSPLLKAGKGCPNTPIGCRWRLPHCGSGLIWPCVFLGLI
jgi:alpha-tubulin suppressor-like RCC1 family protein